MADQACGKRLASRSHNGIAVKGRARRPGKGAVHNSGRSGYSARNPARSPVGWRYLLPCERPLRLQTSRRPEGWWDHGGMTDAALNDPAAQRENPAAQPAGAAAPDLQPVDPPTPADQNSQASEPLELAAQQLGLHEPRLPRVLVVGGGIAGLQMARLLANAGVIITLAEASDRLGGKVRRHTVGGIALDAGAESFATRRGTIAGLATELGLGHLLVTPSGAGAWLQPRTGPAVPLPKAGLLGIPSIPLARDVIRVVGLPGALRAQLDSLMSGLVGSKEHSLGALVRKRMGTAVLERLVTPIASAIHSRHPDDLEVDIVAPRVRRAMLSEGSLSRAVLTVRSAAPAGSAVQGLRGGVFQLAEALERDVSGRIDVRFGVRVARIEPVMVGDADAGHQVTFVDGTCERFDAVVLATSLDAIPIGSDADSPPPFESAALPAGTVTITLATLVLDAPALDEAPRGSGVIVAAGAPGIRAKALTHATAKWGWLAEAAEGKHVIRLSYETFAATDAELREQARLDAAALLGVDLTADDVVAFDRTTWPGASSGDSPVRHGMGPTAAQVSTPSGLVHIGERVSGTGLQAIIAHTTDQAEKLIHDLGGRPGLRLR